MSEHPIRTARKARGWSARQLADAAGVTAQTVYNIETGASLGRLVTVAALADVLGLPLSTVADVFPVPGPVRSRV